ncbi:ROK family transcriptional regulator [Bifidobacterium tsurumiense]|uniref:Transcriptional repressor in the Rok family protein n=1 Tax=Bifidobacterium tsurumiense TaxID=356829 RepID=A0A087EJS0_9BIFI|nr:ROK family transcriptional regulator [Bifidobacterium tsurumiense]KFJ08021.1 transcriptional repressor in the Rok family protein [Bifidobacterium tsurumiense]MDY4677311.1 ROK family transcriptional regulator [Bifidobacterium tsurumiense]MSS12954.1 ROK family transcriptional regulator [Bifidobacterium tsurumiense]
MRKQISNVAQASLSEHNRSCVLRHLYNNGISSRAQIAKALGLTPAAITKITARLLEAGVIEETGDIEGSKNRRSIGLKLDSDRFHIIGVKFARSLVEIGVFDLNGTTLHLEDLPEVSDSTIDSTLTTIHERIEDLLSGDSSIVAIGMAVPGPYLRNAGHTAVVSSMQSWRRVNFLEEFSTAFSVPVFVEQDARAGVLAQYLFADHDDCDTMAYYLVGEGVGLGVLDHGKLINGSLGAATEIGHVSIDINGRPCDCGNVGCLERYCSAVAIHQEINQSNIIPQSEAMGHSQACIALFAKAAQGDAQAQGMVRAIGRIIGYGCVTIVNAFNPERIILGDIVPQAGEPLMQAVRDIIHERVIDELASTTSVEVSKLPTDAAVSGAAAVAITEFLDRPSMFFDVT